jgi:hypothetical protein
VLESAQGHSGGGARARVFDSELGGKKANWRSRPEKIEADLSWDAVARKYLEMFEGAIRLRAGATVFFLGVR